jgi:hypothetical protein
MKKPYNIVQRLTILLISVVAYASTSHPVNHSHKAHKTKAHGKNTTAKKINKIEKAEEGKSTDDEIRHKWDKVDRSKVGGSEENMTLVQVIQFHGAVQEVVWYVFVQFLLVF